MCVCACVRVCARACICECVYVLCIEILILKTYITCYYFQLHDYCISASMLPQSLLHKPQKVQNAAARPVCKSDHIHPVLQTLHSLPVTPHSIHNFTIQYKMSPICFKLCSILSLAHPLRICLIFNLTPHIW